MRKTNTSQKCWKQIFFIFLLIFLKTFENADDTIELIQKEIDFIKQTKDLSKHAFTNGMNGVFEKYEEYSTLTELENHGATAQFGFST